MCIPHSNLKEQSLSRRLSEEDVSRSRDKRVQVIILSFDWQVITKKNMFRIHLNYIFFGILNFLLINNKNKLYLS